MNLTLILIIGMGAWLILAIFAKMSHALFAAISYLILFLILASSIQTTTYWNMIYVFSLSLILAGAVLSFFASREYPYLLSLFLLFFLISAYLLKQNEFSMFLGAVIYLLLVLGVTKDLLYEKFFK